MEKNTVYYKAPWRVAYSRVCVGLERRSGPRRGLQADGGARPEMGAAAGGTGRSPGRFFYGLAAAQGNNDAQARLGTMHYYGQGGPVDFAEAKRCAEPAAAQGHAEALSILGTIHHNGDGGPQNFNVARRLLALAAAQDDAKAQTLLGVMQARGEGGRKDYAEARRLLGLAVAQGHADAQEKLGVLHEQGQGGPTDLAEARRLLLLGPDARVPRLPHVCADVDASTGGVRRSSGGQELCPRYLSSHLCLSSAHSVCAVCTVQISRTALCAEQSRVGRKLKSSEFRD